MSHMRKPRPRDSHGRRGSGRRGRAGQDRETKWPRTRTGIKCNLMPCDCPRVTRRIKEHVKFSFAYPRYFRKYVGFHDELVARSQISGAFKWRLWKMIPSLQKVGFQHSELIPDSLVNALLRSTPRCGMFWQFFYTHMHIIYTVNF